MLHAATDSSNLFPLFPIGCDIKRKLFQSIDFQKLVTSVYILPPPLFFRCVCQEQFPRGYHYRKGTAWSPRNFIKKFSLIFAVTYRCWLQILQVHLSQRPWVLRRNRQTACTFHVSGRAGREKSFIWVAIKRNIHDERLDLTQLCMETILRNLLLTIIISEWATGAPASQKSGMSDDNINYSWPINRQIWPSLVR